MTQPHITAGSQQPWMDGEQVVYFQTPKLADGTHRIDITVSVANGSNPFIIDYFLTTPSTGSSVSGVSTSRSIPTSTSTSSSVPIVTTHDTPVGTIVGGVVGGVAGIAILVLAVLYFLKKRSRGGQAYYFDKPSPADILATEGLYTSHLYVVEDVEGLPQALLDDVDATATTPVPSSAGFTGSGRGPQSRYSDVSSNQPLNAAVRQSYVSSIPSQPNYAQPGPSEGGMTYVTGNTAQPRTGKAAHLSQQFQNAQQPVQYEDSGIRFSQNGVQEAGPSQLPTEVPPSYTPH